MQLRNYEIASDKDKRTYTGILGQEAKHVIPGAVKTVEGINVEDGTDQLKFVNDFHFIDDSLLLSTNIGATQALYKDILDLQEKSNKVTHEVVNLKMTANSTETEMARARAAKAEMEAMAFQLEARKAIAEAEAIAIEREMAARRSAAEAETILAKTQVEIVVQETEKIKANSIIDEAKAKEAEAQATIALQTTKQLELKAAIAEWESQKGSLAASTAESEARKTEAAAVIETEKRKQLFEQRGLLEEEIKLKTEIRLTAEAEAKTAASNLEAEKIKLETAKHLETAKLAEVEANKLKLEAEQATVKANELKLEKERLRIVAEKEQATYEDQLIRNRTAEALKEQDESAERQETRRIETLKLEHQLELEKTKLSAEIDRDAKIASTETDARFRILQERENEDVASRRQAAALQAEHAKYIESIRVGLTSLGNGISEFLTNKEKIMRTVSLFLALVVGVYVAKEGSSMVRQEIQRRLGKPSLVRETTRTTGHFSLYSRLLRWWYNEDPMKVFNDVVLDGDLEGRVKKLAKATRNARANNAPFRHALFYGENHYIYVFRGVNNLFFHP